MFPCLSVVCYSHSSTVRVSWERWVRHVHVPAPPCSCCLLQSCWAWRHEQQVGELAGGLPQAEPLPAGALACLLDGAVLSFGNVPGSMLNGPAARAMAHYSWPNLRNVTPCMLPPSTRMGDISKNSAKIKNSGTRAPCSQRSRDACCGSACLAAMQSDRHGGHVGCAVPAMLRYQCMRVRHDLPCGWC
jgi:hypothetical protein